MEGGGDVISYTVKAERMTSRQRTEFDEQRSLMNKEIERDGEENEIEEGRRVHDIRRLQELAFQLIPLRQTTSIEGQGLRMLETTCKIGERSKFDWGGLYI